MRQDRRGFERWYKAEAVTWSASIFDRPARGEYEHPYVALAWEAWKASRAALFPAPLPRFRGMFAHEDTDRTATRTVGARSIMAARSMLRQKAKAMGPRWSLASVREVKP